MRAAALSEVPVPTLSCKNDGKMHPQVSLVPAAAGTTRRCSLWKTNAPSWAPAGSWHCWAGGVGGPGSSAGLRRNSPGEPISGGRFTVIAGFFLPPQTAPRGGKKPVAEPKINVTQVPAPGRGAGVEGARQPREIPAFARQRKAEKPLFPRVFRQREWDLRGTG